MPTIDVKDDERNISQQKDCAVDSSKLTCQNSDKKNPVKQTKTMPCSPYNKYGSTVPEGLPPDRKFERPPLERNGAAQDDDGLSAAEEVNGVGLTIPSKSQDAPGPGNRSQGSKEAARADTNQAENVEKVNGETAAQDRATNTKSLELKPEIFQILDMIWKKDAGGKGGGRLVRQKSLHFSYEKETHVLTHALSAPAAISDALEPVPEDGVFDEEEEKENKCHQSEEDDGSLKGSSADALVEKVITDSDSVGKKEEDCSERKAAEAGEEDHATGPVERSPSPKESEEDTAKEKKEEKEKDQELSDEKPKMKEGDGDVDVLTESLQTGLKLEDTGSKDAKKDKPDSKDVSELADDLSQGLSLKEKPDKKPFIQTLVAESRMSSTAEQGSNRLRAKGIHKPGVIMTSNTVFAQQTTWGQQPPANHIWQMNAPIPSQTLPSFQIFQKPSAPAQSSQSVVCPPGSFIMGHGSQVLKLRPSSGQSKQIQFAQQHLHYVNNIQQMPQNYTQNCLNSGRSSSVPMSHYHMNIPGESTGTPSEGDWPLSPESDISEVTDLLDIITSDEERVRSPVESEDTSNDLMDMQSDPFLDFAGVPSPQSPWNGSHTASVASSSPASYTEYQQPSPSQQVPDVNGPLTPESNVGSPGMPLSPDSCSFIQAPGKMSSGMVMVPSMSPHPYKRQRNNSSISTSSTEAMEKITSIANYLKEGPDASPRRQQASPQHHSPCQTPPYQPFGAPPTPIHSPHPASYSPQPHMQTMHLAQHNPPTTPIPTQQQQQPPPTPGMYPQSETPPEGEVDAYRKYIAEWSFENVLKADKDKDTILHIAICQRRVALSLAIIERIWLAKKKECLNLKNNLLQTPLYLSVISNLPTLTQILINYGADPTICNKQGNSPLHVAAANGNSDAINAILEALACCGYSVEDAQSLFNCRNYDGKSPLMLAVENHGTQNAEGDFIECRKVVQLLLENFASPTFQDSNSGKTALHYAVELRKIDLILILLEYSDDPGALVNWQMYDGNTALHLIVGRDLPEAEILNIVNILVNRGANVGIENGAKDKPLELVNRKHFEVIRRLHGQGKRNSRR